MPIPRVFEEPRELWQGNDVHLIEELRQMTPDGPQNFGASQLLMGEHLGVLDRTAQRRLVEVMREELRKKLTREAEERERRWAGEAREARVMFGMRVVTSVRMREGEITTATTAREVFPRQEPAAEWKPLPGLKTIFHAGGRFSAPDGRRFDYVFPELARDPGLPRALVASLAFLREGSKYGGRRGDDDVIRVGRNRRQPGPMIRT